MMEQPECESENVAGSVPDPERGWKNVGSPQFDRVLCENWRV